MRLPSSASIDIAAPDAAEAAKSDAPGDIAKKLAEVSKGGEKCKTYKECKDLLAAGKDIDYDGNVPGRWWPAGRQSGIVIYPARSFGQPIDDEVANRAGELPKDKTLVFYCT